MIAEAPQRVKHRFEATNGHLEKSYHYQRTYRLVHLTVSQFLEDSVYSVTLW